MIETNPHGRQVDTHLDEAPHLAPSRRIEPSQFLDGPYTAGASDADEFDPMPTPDDAWGWTFVAACVIGALTLLTLGGGIELLARWLR